MLEYRELKTKMKILKLVFFFTITASQAFAETVFCPDWNCGLTTQWIKENLPQWVIKSDSLSEVILAYISFFMPFLSIFAFVSLVYAGFLYVTSSANEENAEKAKKIVGYVGLGIILVFLSYSIVSLFINLKN